MRNDKMARRHVLNKPLTVRFPDGSKWESRFLPKTNEGTSARVYGYGIRKRLSFSLANTSEYFWQKCIPFRHAQVGIQIGATKMGTLYLIKQSRYDQST
jgi:hypothetical protein